jgi:hypothetical protein
VSNGLSGIDDEVEEYLGELLWRSGDQGHSIVVS